MWSQQEKSSYPALAECIGRGPTGFRAVAGKIQERLVMVLGRLRAFHDSAYGLIDGTYFILGLV